MDLPLVSVIIPTYNTATYISAAVDSVLTQTYSPLEVIVVDDGSTDNTADVLGRYADKIRYLYQPNSGPAAARNRGFSEAHGEFIAFLDADDWWTSDKLEQQIPILLANPNIGLVHADVVYIDGNTGRWFERDRPRPNFIGKCYTRLLYGNAISTSTVVLRRECLENLGPFDNHIPAGVEDYELWMRIARRYEFGYIPRSLATYRQHSTNISHNSFVMTTAELALISRQLKADPSLWQSAGRKQVKRRLFNLHFRLGYLYLDKGSFAEAHYFLSKALRFQPGNAYVWALWLSTFLPARWVSSLRSFKRNFGQHKDRAGAGD
jgi:glycosyltransferase involved in cell wall biosynthesis